MIITSRSTVFWLTLALYPMASLQARKLTIVALGDSTTAGAPFLRSPLEAPPDGAGDTDAFYGTWIIKKNPAWTVLNYGISAQDSAQIRDRLDAALAGHPAYVVLLAGVNDVFQGQDTQMTARNLGGMYREIQRQGSVPIAASILPFDRATPMQAAQIRQLNDWIRATAKKFEIPYVDLNQAVRDPEHPDHLNGTPDGLHPDIGAYRQMGVAVLKIIEETEASR